MTAAARVLSAQDHLNALMAARGTMPTRLAFAAVTENLTDKRAAIWCEDHKRFTTIFELYHVLRWGRHSSADVWWASAEQAEAAGLPHIDACWEPK